MDRCNWLVGKGIADLRQRGGILRDQEVAGSNPVTPITLQWHCIHVAVALTGACDSPLSATLQPSRIRHQRSVVAFPRRDRSNKSTASLASLRSVLRGVPMC